MLNAILERGLATPSLGRSAQPRAGFWPTGNDLWSLRRFVPDKRHAFVLCFLRAALAETADAVVEMQDKLITGVHSLIS